MNDRISLDDPLYGGTQVKIKDNKAKVLWTIIVLFIIGVIVTAITLSKSTKHSLKGQYVAQTSVSMNAITFASNGGFVRDANAFGTWENVGAGKYTFNGNVVTLYYTDGRTHNFYYDSKSDTLRQDGTNDIYRKNN